MPRFSRVMFRPAATAVCKKMYFLLFKQFDTVVASIEFINRPDDANRKISVETLLSA